MNEIVAKATEVGKMIAASDRFQAMKAAQTEADNDAALRANLKAFDELSQKLARMEREVKPIEPDDKRRLRDLQRQVAASPAMQKLARAEADLAELINSVNAAIRSQLAE